MSDYRQQLYDRYVSSHLTLDAQASRAALTPRRPYLQQVIAHHFPTDKSAKILDLGCGHGALVHFARQAGYANCTGVDVSAEQVAAAAAMGIAGVTEGDVLGTLKATAEQSIELVITFDVIEHLTKSELLELADEVRRVLSPTGSWLIHAPNGASPFFGAVRYGDYTHEQAFTPGNLKQLALARGFSGVECYEETPVPHGLKSSVRWLLWKAVRAMLAAITIIETGSADGHVFSRNLLAVVKR